MTTTTDWIFIKGNASEEGAIRSRVNADTTEFQIFSNGFYGGDSGIGTETTNWRYVYGRPGKQYSVRVRLNAGAIQIQQYIGGTWYGDGVSSSVENAVPVYLLGSSAKSGEHTVMLTMVGGSPVLEHYVDGSLVGGTQLFADHEALETWHTANSIPIALETLRRGSYRVDEATDIAAIIAGAGLASGETAGPTAITVGLTNEGALVSRGLLTIDEESDASGVASSGTGTALDPYIIQDLEFFGDTGRCIKLNDSDADYYVEFHNCKVRDGDTFEVDMVAFGTIPVFENCEIYDALNTGGDTWHVKYTADIIHWKKCLFSGATCSHVHGFNGVTAGAIFEDCEFDESRVDNKSTGRILSFVAKPASIDIDRCTFDGSTGTSSATQYAIDIAAGCSDLNIQNTEFIEYQNIISNSNAAASTGVVDAFTYKNNTGVDQHKECILMYNALICDVQNNTFKHLVNGSGYRPVHFSGDLTVSDHHCADVTFKYNHIVKPKGTNVAGNEALESSYTGDFDCQYNYIEGCTEDGIELVWPMDKATFTRTVANNYIKDCDNQGIDVFGLGDYSAWAKVVGPDDLSTHNDLNIYIHNNHGNVSKEAIVLTGCRGVFGHDNYITNSDSVGTEELLLLEEKPTGDAADIEPRNIQFAGPFALTADRVDDVASVSGSAADYEVNYYDTENGTGSMDTVP